MKCKYFFILCGCFWVNVALSVTDADLLYQHLSRIRTFEAHFKQTVLSPEGRVKQQISGKFLLQKPNRFVWQVDQPSQQKIISNGREFWLYQPALKQAIRKPIQASLQKSPIEFLSGSPREFSYYFHINALKKEDQIIFRLKPKDKKIVFQEMQLIFQKKQMRQLWFEDALGQKIKIQFQDIHENAALPSSLFQFVPPKGTDVIQGNKI